MLKIKKECDPHVSFVKKVQRKVIHILFKHRRCEHAITIVNKRKVKIFLVISDFELQTDQRNKGLCNFKREALLSLWTPIAKEKTFLQKRLHSSVGRFKGKPKI